MSTGVIGMAIATLGVIQMVIAYQLGKHTIKVFLVFFIFMLFFQMLGRIQYHLFLL
jgi:hypothetical protein